MSEFLHFFVDPDLFDRYGLRLLGGLLVTAKLVAISFSLGMLLGLLLALARNSGNRFLRAFSGGYIYLFRGSPLLAQLFLLYYGVGSFREFWQDAGLWWFFRDAWNCALLAFTLNTAAYQAEIFRGSLLAIAADLNKRVTFEATFMVSATRGHGVTAILDWLADKLPQGPWLYPEDEVSDAPLRFLAAEITREKIFERLHDELPYRSTVETESWQQRPDGSVRIEQTIYVEREGQRKIVLGEGGQTIKAIGQKARVEIAEAAEAKVHLFLFVKVRENWSDDPERYREMGLEFPKS